jgi:hypothetical protein
MVEADSKLLRVDPARFDGGTAMAGVAGGGGGDGDGDGGPACAASLSAFRWALLFKNVFTFLVVILAMVAVVALGFAVIAATVSSWEPTNTFAALTGAVTGAGSLFVLKQKSQSDKILKEALKDVGDYCGADKKAQLTG